MESIIDQAEALAGNVKSYVSTRVDLLKLEVAEKTSLMIGNLAAAAVVFVIFLCFVAFAGIGLSILIGQWIGKMWAGFLIVSLLYLIKAILVWKMRERLIRIPVMNNLIKHFFKDGATV